MPTITLDAALIYGLAFSYICFALQTGHFLRGRALNARRAGAILPLIAVFLVCALAHTLHVPTELGGVHRAAYLVAIVTTWVLILRMAGRILADMLTRS